MNASLSYCKPSVNGQVNDISMQSTILKGACRPSALDFKAALAFTIASLLLFLSISPSVLSDVLTICIFCSIISCEKIRAEASKSSCVILSMTPSLLAISTFIGIPEVINSIDAFAPAILGNL